MTINSVHIWGFFNQDGERKLPAGCAPSELSPYQHWGHLQANLAGSGVHDLAFAWVTRTLDGSFQGIEFESPEKDEQILKRMWHMIMVPSAEWPAKAPVEVSTTSV